MHGCCGYDAIEGGGLEGTSRSVTDLGTNPIESGESVTRVFGHVLVYLNCGDVTR
jgi:hypothetical protein